MKIGSMTYFTEKRKRAVTIHSVFVDRFGRNLVLEKSTFSFLLFWTFVKIGAVKATLGVSNVSGAISTVFIRVGRFDKEYVHINGKATVLKIRVLKTVT